MKHAECAIVIFAALLKYLCYQINKFERKREREGYRNRKTHREGKTKVEAKIERERGE